MASFVKFQPFVENLGSGYFNLKTNQLAIGLTTNANVPDITDSVLADITPIAYTNLSSRNVTTTSYTQTGGTATLVCADLVLTASGAVATFRHVFLYSTQTTTITNGLIAMWDYGSDVTLANLETFTIDFGANVFSLA